MRRFFAVVLAFFALAYGIAGLSRPAFAGESQVPSASAGGQPAVVTKAEVHVRERVIVTLHGARGEASVTERARKANQAVDSLIDKAEDLGEVRLDEHNPGTGVLFVGSTPIVTLGEDDAAGEGEPSLHVYASAAEKRLSDAVKVEKRRARIATMVFSVSLLVLSGLIAFLLVGRVGDLSGRIRSHLAKNPEKVSGVRVGNIELVSVAASRGALSVLISVAHRLSQAAIAYGWILFALSLFEATRHTSEKLTGVVFAPLSALVARVANALPLLIVAVIAGLAVSILVRFVGLFFESVVRGETRIGWLPQDLARPTSMLLRGGILVVALVLASPLLTGSEDGALSRAGLAALAALALAVTPLLACAAVGIIAVYGRRFRRGEFAEIGGRRGRILETTLFEVRLEDAHGCELRVPHFTMLMYPTRVLGRAPLSTVELIVPTARAKEAQSALIHAVRALSTRATVELVRVDGSGAHLRVTARDADWSGGGVSAAVLDVLEAHGLGGNAAGLTPEANL